MSEKNGESFGHGTSGDKSTGLEPTSFHGLSGGGVRCVQDSSYLPPSECRSIDPNSAEGRAVMAQLQADLTHKRSRFTEPVVKDEDKWESLGLSSASSAAEGAAMLLIEQNHPECAE